MAKVIFITGASSGIGRATGEFLLSKGYTVYGTSRKPENIKDSKFPLVALDVRQTETIQKAVQHVINEAGAIDVLVNNAGVGITGPIEEVPADEIKNNFEVNLFGPIEVIKAVLPQMRKQKSGLIINVTSIAGYMGLPYRGIYSASKGALELITEAMRMEVKPFGVTLTSIAPGDFATNIAAGRYHAPVTKGSPYEVSYGNTLSMMDEHVDDGNDPLQMAEAIYAIMKDPNPEVHYKVGAFMQKFSVTLKKILPGKAYEKLLMKHYKL